MSNPQGPEYVVVPAAELHALLTSHNELNAILIQMNSLVQKHHHLCSVISEKAVPYEPPASEDPPPAPPGKTE